MLRFYAPLLFGGTQSERLDPRDQGRRLDAQHRRRSPGSVDPPPRELERGGCCRTRDAAIRSLERSGSGKVPIDRLAEIAPACRISRARIVDAGRIVTAGGIASGMEMGFYLLRRAGYDDAFVAEVAGVMEYTAAYDVYRDDVDVASASDESGTGNI